MSKIPWSKLERERQRANGRSRRKLEARRNGGLPASCATSTRPLTAYYEQCDDALSLEANPGGNYVPSYRWWLSNNPGDVFDIITKAQVDERVTACKALGIRTVDHLPGFCTKDCPDHLGWT